MDSPCIVTFPVHLHSIPDTISCLGSNCGCLQGSRIDLSHPTLRCYLVSVANEMLPAHDTYYMDDRMVVLSVGTLCWVYGQSLNDFPVWREVIQSPSLALEEVLPINSVTPGRTRHRWNRRDLRRYCDPYR